MKIDAAALKRWRADPVLFVQECLIDPETGGHSNCSTPRAYSSRTPSRPTTKTAALSGAALRVPEEVRQDRFRRHVHVDGGLAVRRRFPRGLTH